MAAARPVLATTQPNLSYREGVNGRIPRREKGEGGRDRVINALRRRGEVVKSSKDRSMRGKIRNFVLKSGEE